MESTTRKGFYLFRLFFKSMMFAFTSGMAAIPSIERGIVEKKKWLSHEEFWTYPVLGQSLPGVISIHNSILLGNRIAGPFGAFMALMGVITPPFVCMLSIAMLFQTLVDNPYIQGMIRGIRVISIVLIFGNGIRLLSTVRHDLLTVVLVVIAAAAPLFFNFSAFWTIVICGTIGIISVLTSPDDHSQKQPTKQAEE